MNLYVFDDSIQLITCDDPHNYAINVAQGHHFSSKPKPASRSQLLMESWLKKGTGKRESDREINESTVDQQETTGDVNSVITKKAKKEQNSAAL